MPLKSRVSGLTRASALLAALVAASAGGAEPAPTGKPVCAECGVVTRVIEVQRPVAPERRGAPSVTDSPRVGGMGGSVQTVPLFSMGREGVQRVEPKPAFVKVWEVTVRFDNGAYTVVPLEAQPEWKAGDRVKMVDNHLEALPPPKP